MKLFDFQSCKYHNSPFLGDLPWQTLNVTHLGERPTLEGFEAEIGQIPSECPAQNETSQWAPGQEQDIWMKCPISNHCFIKSVTSLHAEDLKVCMMFEWNRDMGSVWWTHLILHHPLILSGCLNRAPMLKTQDLLLNRCQSKGTAELKNQFQVYW